MAVKGADARELRIERESQRILDAGVSAAEYSARVFGPDGLLRELWSTEAERGAVVESPLYRRLQANLSELRRRDALGFDAEVERFSGRLTVVVPKSLHAALRGEAAREGVSLSELIRLKLGVPYQESARFLVTGRAKGT